MNIENEYSDEGTQDEMSQHEIKPCDLIEFRKLKTQHDFTSMFHGQLVSLLNNAGLEIKILSREPNHIF